MKEEARSQAIRGLSWLLALGLITMGALLACAPPEPASAPAAETLKLPVSLNDVMVALVNQAADPIWVAAWHHPETDKEWRELEREAYRLEIAGSLLPYAGTGPIDQEWVAKEGWKRWADSLRDAGAGAVTAVQSRDVEAVAAAGDRIVEVCEGCHTEFKLDMPTGGKFGELSPTAADLEKEEGKQ